MTDVKIFTPPNRLAKVLIDVGGRTSDEIVETANIYLEELEDPLRQTVARQVARIMALQRQGEEVLRSRAKDLGDAALAIAEIAGAAKQPAAGEAARGLRAMVDAQAASGLWHPEAIALHIAALSLLSEPVESSPAQTSLVLARLHAMRVVIGIPD